MKRLLTILFLFLTLGLSGQILPGVVASRPAVVSGVTAPSFLTSDGDTWAWYKYDESSTITKDGSNSVTVWNDFLGGVNNLTNYGGTPLWSNDGVLFNGTDEYLHTGSKTLSNVVSIYIVFRQISWTLNDIISAGYAGSAGLLYQNPTTSKLNTYSGGFMGSDGTMDVNEWGIVRMMFNGASSTFQVNAETAFTGTTATNLNGFSLGADANGGTPNGFSNVEIKEVIIRKTIDDATEQSAVYNYLKTKYGL